MQQNNCFVCIYISNMLATWWWQKNRKYW